ncbi:MAG: transporter related protein [Nocardioides sp.]|nr:transporter related protein [Nocardioides sp.]
MGESAHHLGVDPERPQGEVLGVTSARSLMCGGPRTRDAGYMIKVESLTKTYGAFTAVDDVTFTALPGRVTGFLGPNGAGKSTSMRIMVGLTPASSGYAEVSGRRFADLPNPGLEVGVLLDASAQHAGRTGREILMVSQMMMGLPASRVDEMLDLVSLTPTESARRVRNYSLGMRQRLGIATALLGDPEVLILDEPANGLDPAGIRWMRDLLRGYADKGGTVLLSSHLLHEIEVIADDLVVIGNGKIVAQGTKAELLRAAGTLVRTPNVQDLANALTASGVAFQPSHATGSADALRVDAEPELVGKVAHLAGVPLAELRAAEGAGLEEMFLELTADTQRDGAAA